MNEELMHHGVKGMKWGVRRKRSTISSTGSKGFKKKKTKIQEEVHEDYKNAHSKKSVSSMSDAELRARINRIQMEQQYSKLNPSSVQVGRERTQAVLKSMATVATTTGTLLTIYNNTSKINDIIKKMGQS